ncbi:MAG: insulinase family protein, partial [Deltaproteobacteria bacterium]|nr:insulinase family protein [Deltaproteobacteria bacterium]
AAVAVGLVAPEPPQQDALARARDEGLAELHSDVEGDANSARASVGGARVVARRTPGAPRVTVALSFLGGASEEPPALHGRSALLAHLMAERCGVDAGTLNERLRALGGRATASIEPSRFGVIFELPRARWRLAIDLAARCALRPPSARTDIDGVRTDLLAHRSSEDELAERSARLLSPDHPGRVAPEGSGVALTRLTLGELEEAHDELVVRARVRAAVLGDLPADAAASRLARWLEPLPEGRAPSLQADWPTEQGDPLANPETPGDVPRLLLSLRVPGGNADLTPWVRTLAHDLGRRLGGDGVRFEGSAAGSDPLGSWLSVELAVDRASIDGIPSRVAAALRELGVPSRGAVVRSDAAARAWGLTATRAPSISPPELVEAFKRATPTLQLRGVGRSPSLERLRP